tara:strand:- start:1161 stop:1400 length:240 start_codon:yes stop_codon:yes gene_type:complete
MNDDLIRGQIIRVDDVEGEVNFIGKEYITVTTHRWNLPPEVAEHSRHPYRETNVLVYNNRFHLIERYDTESKQWKYINQ